MEPLKPGYWLAHHVYVCRVNDAVIFLDTQTDSYGAVVGEQMQLLGAVVHGWPAEPPAEYDERARDLADLHDKAEFVRISSAGLRESHVHDVTITRESPNYPSRG